MTATAPRPPDTDVVCLGEAMVAFRPSRPGRLADVPSFERGVGGAEANVACALAAAGHRARWIGRVGADGFGDHVVAALAAYGVDVSAVQRDPRRPTGVYFRTAGERAVSTAADGQPFAEVVYHRTGSAASAMSPELIARETAWSGRVLHLTGITPALSAGCLALVRGLTAAGPGRPLVSFDVNYRVGLWRDRSPALLAGLARRCDIVFVGEDEAEAAWGLRGGAAIRAALPEPDILVVKQGAGGATAYVRGGPGRTGDASADRVVSAPALTVDVVAPVGAGDAFAAGFLSAGLRGLDVRTRLRHGHLMAAAALTTDADLARPPERAHADRLAALDAGAWGRLRLGPGWTGHPPYDGVDENTPEEPAP
ncbi:sugar kinase [Streptomyces sp. NPDC046215]|uniref:sugar kinase n=1 Tax=Streptomyces TaxID=1883 RepID=UPI0031D4037A